MKLALCGTHGSGKTTLAIALAKRLGLPALTQSVTTECAMALGYKKASEIPPALMKEFQWRAYSMQQKIENSHERFVTHRSPVDYLAYFLYQVPDSTAAAQNYASVCLYDARAYDAIIVLPPPRIQVDDGRRHVGGEEIIDSWIRSILVSPREYTDGKLELPPIIYIASDGPENRASEAIEKLDANKKPQRSGYDII